MEDWVLDYLITIGADDSGWISLSEDLLDLRYCELSFPESEMHVRGTYINERGERRTTGSLGCFILSGDNKSNVGRDEFIKDVSNRIK